MREGSLFTQATISGRKRRRQTHEPPTLAVGLRLRDPIALIIGFLYRLADAAIAGLCYCLSPRIRRHVSVLNHDRVRPPRRNDCCVLRKRGCRSKSEHRSAKQQLIHVQSPKLQTKFTMPELQQGSASQYFKARSGQHVRRLSRRLFVDRRRVAIGLCQELGKPAASPANSMNNASYDVRKHKPLAAFHPKKMNPLAWIHPRSSRVHFSKTTFNPVHSEQVMALVQSVLKRA